MLHQLINIPRSQHFYVACSGGVDSMVVSDFYKRGNKHFSIAHFNHNTPQADEFQSFVSKWAVDNDVPFVSFKLDEPLSKGVSKEEFWRDHRYRWFSLLKDPVVVCQHLNDVSETWLFSSLHGTPKIIQPRRDNVIRPFLTNSKQSILDWASRHNVRWIEDKSNADTKVPRNNIRHRILPLCLEINPGLLKVMKKKVLAAV